MADEKRGMHAAPVAACHATSAEVRIVTREIIDDESIDEDKNEYDESIQISGRATRAWLAMKRKKKPAV